MSHIRRLILSNFRNYGALDVEVEATMVVLLGENGAGKTNLLEAISLFTPGRGLRRAELPEMVKAGGAGGFSVATVITGAGGERRMGVGFHPDEASARRCRIDGQPAPSASAFAEYCRLIWLTPDNDGLFRGPAGDRRRFLDRLVLTVDAAHGARVNALERALRTRNRLLEEIAPDAGWLDAVERELAETGVAVAAARRETVMRLSALLQAGAEDAAPFPTAAISLEGELEGHLDEATSLEVEDAYRRLLAQNRWKDRAAGRTLIGPNGSDLKVRHGPKNIPAELASTGEQKALLIGLCLAHAELVRQMTGHSPLLLLDEVAAHLDGRRRAALYGRIASLGGQAWMTGVDESAFSGINTPCARFIVADGILMLA